jgi:hypothetical protein
VTTDYLLSKGRIDELLKIGFNFDTLAIDGGSDYQRVDWIETQVALLANTAGRVQNLLI